MNGTFLFPVFIVLLVIIPVSIAEQSFIPSNPDFRPTFSQKFTGFISPDQPMKISTIIRDSDTGFFKIYVWGQDQNKTNLDLWTSPGNEVIAGLSAFKSATNEYPEVVTVSNSSSGYLMADPGEYSSLISSSQGSGTAEVYVYYVYHNNIDMGQIQGKDYSVWEIEIPAGLSRVIFATESVNGTDLDLFIEKGETLPDSFENFTYSSTSRCTDCWGTGIDNWLAEMFVIDNPEPGKYLMVTYAHGGNDFFTTYWMGTEADMVNIISKNTTSQDRAVESQEIKQKYAKIPYDLTFTPEKEENLTLPDDLGKAYQINPGGSGS